MYRFLFPLLALVLTAACDNRPLILGDDTGIEADTDTDTDTDADSDADADTDADTDDVDADGDGYNSDDDCDDTDASVHPGATEECNGVDDDCDGTVDEDCPARSTEWLVVDDAWLGIDHGVVFTWIDDDGDETVADPDDICVAGYGFGGDEDWNYSSSRAVDYDEGMDWYEFPEDVLFRITYRTHGSSALESTWAQYGDLCEESETVSDLCWENLGGLQEDGWSLCLKVVDGTIRYPGHDACEHTPDP